MSDPLLFVPDYRFTPATCELLPGTRAALDALRQRFEVTVFDWYTGAVGASVVDVVRRVREKLVSGGHLVATSGNAAFGLLAASGSSGLMTFSCDGICVPAATLRSMGMDTTAEAALACLRIDVIRGQGLLALLEGASESEAERIIGIVSAEADWAYVEELLADYSTIDLVDKNAHLSMPALYLEPAAHFSGWVEMSNAFLRFAPQSDIRRLEDWPRRVHSAQAGRELADHILSFISAVSTGPIEPVSRRNDQGHDSATSSVRSSLQ